MDDVITGVSGNIDLKNFCVVDSGTGWGGSSGSAAGDFYVSAGGGGVSGNSGGSGGSVPLTWTTTSASSSGDYKPFTITARYGEEGDMEFCQFCDEPKVREVTEKKLVKGRWKTRTTYYYKCGTSKTVGDYKVKKPRVRISKNCVGFKK